MVFTDKHYLFKYFQTHQSIHNSELLVGNYVSAQQPLGDVFHLAWKVVLMFFVLSAEQMQSYPKTLGPNAIRTQMSFLKKRYPKQNKTKKKQGAFPSTAYLTTFSAELILYVMVSECCSLRNTGYSDSCLLLSCSVSGGKGQRKGKTKMKKKENE